MRTHATERFDRSLVKLFAVAAITLLTLAVVGAAGAGNGKRDKTDLTAGAVYAMTNDAAGNEVLAFERDDDGSLSLQGTYSTDGEGTSRIRLSSQGPVVLTEDGQQLLVANVGSSEISVFDVRRNSLKLRSIVPSGGSTPNSITVRGDLVYVLNNGLTGLGNITGFRLTDKSALIPIAGSTRPLSAPEAIRHRCRSLRTATRSSSQKRRPTGFSRGVSARTACRSPARFTPPTA